MHDWDGKYFAPMFKKRTIKKGQAVKRTLETTDEGDSREKVREEGGGTRDIKELTKFKKLKTSAKPSRDVVYHEDGKLIEKDNTAVVDTKEQEPKVAIPVNVRTTTITDFQPDICKDYAQTGYCGYGDTCKFLHIRDEKKATARAPVTKEWEQVKDSSEKPAEEIPFKCVICRDDYKNPIKTICNHYFCKDCFIKRFKNKKPACFICNKDTGGIFHPLSPAELKLLLPPS